MQAVVLVGGMGTRLRPLTHEIPKQMLCVAGVTMLERVVERLGTFGVDRVILSMGYRPDVFMEAFPGNRIAGIELVYAVEPEPLDTGGAIRFASDFGEIDETFLVVNGDVLCDFDLGLLIDFHQRNPGSATIALYPVEDPSAFGVVPTTQDGRVTAFIEKPPRDTAPTNHINAGIYVLDMEALDGVFSGERVSIEKVVFPHLVEQGKLYAYEFEGSWVDAGTIDTFYNASREFLALLTKASSEQLSVAERSLIGSMPTGYHLIDGSLISFSAKIMTGALITSSIIGPGVLVETGASVVNSIVMEGATVSHHSYVHDSIVGNLAKIPAETVVEDLSVVALGCELDSGVRLSGQKIPS